ncbi:hypothetical protein ACFFHM_18435 [Halalkalibacter kiskunsagensis]|uniref:Uncharacterized protein n=1 Tax=Halalkalibacter kiskunsagensis TaxID=1548599 RepID=A0ABV6KGF5_9BACI
MHYLTQLSFSKLLFLITAFLITSIIGFFLIDLFTINPLNMSGNGNVGIIPMIFALPSYAAFTIFISTFSYKILQYFTKKWALLALLFIFILFVSIANELLVFTNALITHLGGGPNEPNSLIYQYGWFNQYTNTLYFNWFTFNIGVYLAVIISCILRLGKTNT